MSPESDGEGAATAAAAAGDAESERDEPEMVVPNKRVKMTKVVQNIGCTRQNLSIMYKQSENMCRRAV